MEVRDTQNKPDMQEKSQKTKELSPLINKVCAAKQVYGIENPDYETGSRLLALPEN